MEIQFINTLNANRFLLAISVPVRKLHDTTASLPQFLGIEGIRYLLCDYHFGTNSIVLDVKQHEISSGDVESLVELGQVASAHDWGKQAGFVATETFDNDVISSNRSAA
jgi:hypothetical protein